MKLHRDDWYLERPIAHRGLHNIHDGVIEHSRRAIRRAIAADLPIEIDLVCSLDHENFVIHDFFLDHLTDKVGDIRTMEAALVAEARLNVMDDEPILKFSELLELVNGKVPIMVEIKSREPVINNSVIDACRALKKYDGLYSVQSFNPFVLDWVYEMYPEFCIGLLTYDTDYLEHRGKYILSMLNRRWVPDFIGHQMNATNCWTFQWVLGLHIPIIAFTVRDQEGWDEAKKYSSNMFFEYVEPCKTDWRIPSPESWRHSVGEVVDRRFCSNPIRASALPTDPTPWFNRKKISSIDYL